MKAERLIELYDRISEAPDAVGRLRRFVLDLAVRGKLVEQDPEDEHASKLLERVEAERNRRAQSGEFKEPRNRVHIERDSLPFNPPNHWVWARLIDIAKPSYGFAFPSSEFNKDKRGMPLIRIRDISKDDTEAYFDGPYDPSYVVQPGDYLVGMDGDFNLRRWKGKEALLNQRVMRIRDWQCGINADFVRLPLQFVLDHLHGSTSLTTVKHLSAKQVNGIEVPLPPIAEQHRIVAKVEELMALCDRLEKQHGTREATRDRLTTATLSRLTAPDTDEQSFRDHARFALDTLPALTARSDQIKALRQTILDLAVRGELVDQEPEDEPATELFNRLTKAKEEAFALEGLRKRPPVSESARELGSIHAPASWMQAKFDDLFVIVSGVTKGQKLSDHESVEANYMRVANVQRGFLDLSVVKKIKVRATDVTRYRLECGDVLMTEGGDWDKLGRAAVWRGQISDCIHQNHVFRLRPPSPELLPEWVVLFANSAVGRSFFAEASKRTTNLASINMTQLRSCPLPLPPTSEQHRIVAKVDELMALCDRLEANLEQADDKRARLLEALLAEALAPAEAALEAA